MMKQGARVTGRIRPATLEEAARREELFRPDAVLAVSAELPADLPPFERHVAGLIDGVRPVARVRKKCGLSAADLVIAVGSLWDRGLVRLAGIVEVTREPVPPSMWEPPAPGEPTISGTAADLIPPHVMAEIQAMLDEVDVLDEMEGLDGIDDDTEVLTRK